MGRNGLVVKQSCLNFKSPTVNLRLDSDPLLLGGNSRFQVCCCSNLRSFVCALWWHTSMLNWYILPLQERRKNPKTVPTSCIWSIYACTLRFQFDVNFYHVHVPNWKPTDPQFLNCFFIKIIIWILHERLMKPIYPWDIGYLPGYPKWKK